MRALAKKRSYHWWLVEETPKKLGRLGQLNKLNNRQKVDSEFVLMARRIENEPSKQLLVRK